MKYKKHIAARNARRAAFDALPPNLQLGKKRPGSLTKGPAPHKKKR